MVTPGATAATVGIFLPAFLFVAFSGPLVPRLRRSVAAGTFLDGVNVASLALMAVVTWQLGWSAVRDLPTGVLAVAGAVLLLRFRVNASWLVAAGALAGVLLYPAAPLRPVPTPQTQPRFVLIVLDDLDTEAARVMATLARAVRVCGFQARLSDAISPLARLRPPGWRRPSERCRCGLIDAKPPLRQEAQRRRPAVRTARNKSRAHANNS